jgi:Ca2+-transporting ATPase
LIEIVNKYNVYARVNPIHKLRIVHALQKQDLIVAMTGDGVNDAPAIKDANVGIGMGITGTDVTKNVSDVVLLEESFSTIVVAIKEGRRIFANIRNNVVYSLSSNIAELLIVITGMFTGNIILLPIHILFIDLITDSIPSIALSFEGAAKGIMNEKPNSVNKPIFTPFILSCIITSAIVESIMVLFVYFYTYKHISPTIAMEVALLSLVIQELVYAVTCRNLKTTIINQGLFSNKAMNISLIILIIVELIFFLTPVGSVISIEALSITNVLMVVLFNVFSFFIYEFLKPLLIKRFKD